MNRYLWMSIAVITAVIVTTLAMYGSLPERMPTHWNIQGEVDGWSSKSSGVSIMPVAMIVLFLIFLALPMLSPRQFTVESFRSTYDFITFCILAYCGYMQIVILVAAMNGQIDTARMMIAGVCMLLAALGNVLGKVRRNFWVGVRTPWTIASDHVWNATHRLAAKLFVGAGVLGLLAVISGLPAIPMFVVIFSGIMFAALFPIGYSLYLYKVLERRSELEPIDAEPGIAPH